MPHSSTLPTDEDQFAVGTFRGFDMRGDLRDYPDAPIVRAGSGRAHKAKGSYAPKTPDGIAAFITSTDSYLDTRRIAATAFAESFGAKAPTDAVLSDDQRFTQWSDRLAWAARCPEAGRVAAIAEADLYSGNPVASRPWPAPLPAFTFPA